MGMAEEQARTREREAKQLNEPEQKYDLELSFPVDSDEATNIDGRRARIDSLIEEILSNEALAVNDTLPGTLLDPSSIKFEQSYRCESGEVVVDDQCVPCPPGTYFDEAEKICTKCAVGFYNPDSAQRACIQCPTIQDIEGVTESLGATSSSDCKEKCAAGNYYDKVTDLCRPCGHGRYQANEGKFTCDLCGVGLTTRTKKAISQDECRADCEDGHQLSINAECEVCPIGTYRTQGRDRGCQECPLNRTTSKTGSKTEEDCNLPICVPGQYLNANNNQILSKPNVLTAHQTPAQWKAILTATLEQPVPRNALTAAWLKKAKPNCAIKMPTVYSSPQIPSAVLASLVTKAMALDPIAALTNVTGTAEMMAHA